MDQSQGRAHIRIKKILEKRPDLFGHQLSFINYGTGRKTADIKKTLLVNRRLMDPAPAALAQNVELAVKFFRCGVHSAANKDLL